MFGRIIGALAGRAAGRNIGGARSGVTGMIVGAALPMVMRRFGPLGLIGLAAGSWAVKKFAEKSAEPAAAEPLGDAQLPKPD